VKGLIDYVHEIGQWLSVKMNFCKNKAKATKSSFVANTTEIVARILKNWKETEDISGEGVFGFRRARGC
jgi:hypothetical protein